MDILIEILIEIYMELMMLIVPEEKRGKRHYRIATLVAIVCTLGVISLGVVGVVLIMEQGRALGIVFLVIAIVLSVAQIVAGIVLFIRRNKIEKQRKQAGVSKE